MTDFNQKAKDPLEQAHMAQRALRLAPNRRRAAKLIGLTVPTMNKRLALLDLPMEFIAAYRQGHISRTAFLKLVGLTPPARTKALALLKKEGRLVNTWIDDLRTGPTREELHLRSVVNRMLASGKSVDDILNIVTKVALDASNR